jgi:hypothetical protein
MGHRVAIALAAASALVVGHGTPALGHLEEPGIPLIVKVEWTGVGTTANLDDAPNGLSEIFIRYEIIHQGHGAVAGDALTTYDFASPGNTFGPGLPAGGMQVISPPILLYSHEECSPENAIRIDAKAWEDDTPPFGDTYLGHGAAVASQPIPAPSRSRRPGGPRPPEA